MGIINLEEINDILTKLDSLRTRIETAIDKEPTQISRYDSTLVYLGEAKRQVLRIKEQAAKLGEG